MNAEFIYFHFKLLLEEKVTMEKPNNYVGHPDNENDIKKYLNKLKEYENHIASRRSFHYELSEADHGKSKFEGIDFEVKKEFRDTGGLVPGWEFVAVPIVKDTVQEQRLKTDCNVFIDRAIEMLKDLPEIKYSSTQAGYNGVISLLRYAKESHIEQIKNKPL